MCGISGIFNLKGEPIPDLGRKLEVMNHLLLHRGLDDAGTWRAPKECLGFAHRRLSIIDLSAQGKQPMLGNDGSVIVFNGEIYNYRELRQKLEGFWDFKTHSDTEVILAAYARYKEQCLDHLEGMFAFALWDGETLFCARDRFGIKPFYFFEKDHCFYFASEVKALLPFVDDIATDKQAFSEYIHFQQVLSHRTLFKNIFKCMPGHFLRIERGKIEVKKYWELQTKNGGCHQDMIEQTRDHVKEAVKSHLTSDVKVGCHLSGGIDSSIIAILAKDEMATSVPLFHGWFDEGTQFDEREYANLVAKQLDQTLYARKITATDFSNNIEKIIYHMDYPSAGPGVFPQYMLSSSIKDHVKVVLGGQGADEYFGGYTRFFIAYMERCLKNKISGQSDYFHNPIPFEDMTQNLSQLAGYEPLMKRFWSNGLFDPLEARYFALIDRSENMQGEVDGDILHDRTIMDHFHELFSQGKGSDCVTSMMNFELNHLLQGLLHVEDRVSMAHGIESRVPFLDHRLVEHVASIPVESKLKNGQLKYLLKEAFREELPAAIFNRKNKMGFPVPLAKWQSNELKDFFHDTFSRAKNKHREFVNYDFILNSSANSPMFSRKIWGLLSLEIWHQTFHDKSHCFQSVMNDTVLC